MKPSLLETTTSSTVAIISEHCLQSNSSFQSNENPITKDDGDDDDECKIDYPVLSTASTMSASVDMITENLSTISMVMTTSSSLLLENKSSSTETTMSDESINERFTTTMYDEDEVVWKTTEYDRGLLTSSTVSASSGATTIDEKNIILSSSSSTEMLGDTDEEKEKAEYLDRIIPNISLSYSDYHLDTFVFM
jgi:membrane-bound inhibitor of C-type lysozyme